MIPVTPDDFFHMVKAVGVGDDPRYPESGCLVPLPARAHDRFWSVPGDAGTIPHFVDRVLAGLDPWDSLLLWPRYGRWPATGETADGQVRSVVLRGAGVPAGGDGALRISSADRDGAMAVVYAFLAFGWCVDDDLFVVPDHGRQVLQTDHHGVVHALCKSGPRIRAFVAHMAGGGYDLPTELPDATFKRPAWMTEEAGLRDDEPV